MPCCSQTSSEIFAVYIPAPANTPADTVVFHMWIALPALSASIYMATMSLYTAAACWCGAHCASESCCNLNSVGRAQAERNCLNWSTCLRHHFNCHKHFIAPCRFCCSCTADCRCSGSSVASCWCHRCSRPSLTSGMIYPLPTIHCGWHHVAY